jgi:hypothetical protein
VSDTPSGIRSCTSRSAKWTCLAHRSICVKKAFLVNSRRQISRLTAEERWFRSSFLPIIPIMAVLGSIFILFGIAFGDIRPIIVLAVFSGLFAAFYVYAKRPETVIGYPDGPIWTLGTKGQGSGARMLIIPRDRCQFKGCKDKVSLSQCEQCDKTYCSQHLREHDCRSILLVD